MSDFSWEKAICKAIAFSERMNSSYISFLAYRWGSCRIILLRADQSVQLEVTKKMTNETHRGTRDDIEKDVGLRGDTVDIYHLIRAPVRAKIATATVDHAELVKAHPAPPERSVCRWLGREF